jgi:hypothetical protein
MSQSRDNSVGIQSNKTDFGKVQIHRSEIVEIRIQARKIKNN